MAYALKIDKSPASDEAAPHAVMGETAEQAVRPKVNRPPAFLTHPQSLVTASTEEGKKPRRRFPYPPRDVVKFLLLVAVLTLAVGYGISRLPSTSRSHLETKLQREAPIVAATPVTAPKISQGQNYTPDTQSDISSRIIAMPPIKQSPDERNERRKLLDLLTR